MREDWSYPRLGEVVDFRGGGTPSKRNKTFWGGEIPWVSPKDMKVRAITSSADTITADALDKSAARLIPLGAILVVVRSGILARTIPIAVAGRDLTVNQDLKALCPTDAIQTEYLHYFLEAAEPELLQRVTRGATVHRLATDSLKGLRVPLPSEREQKRIVAILDEAFVGIDAAVANAEKNRANARELFESYLHSVFGQIYDNREKEALDELLRTGAGGTPLRSRAEYYDGGDIPWLLSGEVAQGEITQATNFITEEGLKNSSAKIFPEGTVLVAMYGATAGEVGVLRIPATTNQAVCGIYPNEMYLPEFLYYLFRYRKAELVAQAAGNAQPNISQKKIRQTPVPLIPVPDQQRAVAGLIQRLDDTARLGAIYTRKLAALDELKQSILQKAFSGGLTATKAEKEMAAA